MHMFHITALFYFLYVILSSALKVICVLKYLANQLLFIYLIYRGILTNSLILEFVRDFFHFLGIMQEYIIGGANCYGLSAIISDSFPLLRSKGKLLQENKNIENVV